MKVNIFWKNIYSAGSFGNAYLFEKFKKALNYAIEANSLASPNCTFSEFISLCNRIAAAWFLERSRWSKPYLFKDFSAIINCNVISVGSL